METIKISMDAGALISEAGRARAELEKLRRAKDAAFAEAGQTGNYTKHAALSVQYGNMQASASGLSRQAQAFLGDPGNLKTGAGGETLLALNERQIRAMEALIKSIDKNSAEHSRLIDSGSEEDAVKAAGIAALLEKDRAELAGLLGGRQERRGGQDAGHGPMSGVWLNQIMSSVNTGLGLWLSQLDRSGIIAQKGSGDIAGGILAEKRLESNTQAGAGKMVANIVGAALPWAIGAIVPPLGFALKGAKLAATAARGVKAARAARAVGGAARAGGGAARAGGGAARAGGRAARGGGGGWGGFALASLISSLGDIWATWKQNEHNQLATDIAKGNQWLQHTDRAMNLAAVLGDAENVRGSFNRAAAAAAEFGYSAEDGAAMVKQAAQSGLTGGAAYAAAGEVFRYERATGADRGALMGLHNLNARIGGGENALGAAWAGLRMSGMTEGQFNEFLRGVTGAMESGVSRGFATSAHDASRSLAELAAMMGGNRLWTGEHGARRLAQINDWRAGAAELESSSDMTGYLAMRDVLENDSELRRQILGTVDDDLNYINVSRAMENPLAAVPHLQAMIGRMVNGNGREGAFHGLTDMGFGRQQAWELLNAYGDGTNMDLSAFERIAGQGPDRATSPEHRAAELTEKIRLWLVEDGQENFDTIIGLLESEFGRNNPPSIFRPLSDEEAAEAGATAAAAQAAADANIANIEAARDGRARVSISQEDADTTTRHETALRLARSFFSEGAELTAITNVLQNAAHERGGSEALERFIESADRIYQMDPHAAYNWNRDNDYAIEHKYDATRELTRVIEALTGELREVEVRNE